MTDLNSYIQSLSKGDTAQMTISLLASIDNNLKKLVALSEFEFQKSPGFSDMLSRLQGSEPPKTPQIDPSRIPTFEPQEKDIMRDSSGLPEIVRFPLPNAHGTVIYKKYPGPPAPGGFTISVQGPDGLMKKYEEIPTGS